jgi:hypothetical protein
MSSNFDITGETSHDTVPLAANKRLVLEEQRRAFDSISNAAGTLDNKLQALLGSASLIISLLSTIQIATLRETAGWLFWLGLVVIAALYIWMVYIIIGGLKPLEYFTPIPNTWEQLTDEYFAVSENTALNQQISNYLDYGERNRTLNFQKIKAVHRATRLFLVILIALLFSMALSLNNSSNYNLINQSPNIPQSPVLPTVTINVFAVSTATPVNAQATPTR